MRKTKIICTLGPRSENKETIKRLIQAGMNVARLNFSHGSYEEHSRRITAIKEAREELAEPVGILLDTKGPEIRIGDFENGRIDLQCGQRFTLTTEQISGTSEIVSVSYQELPKFLKKGDRVLIDDGLVELEVVQCTQTAIECIVKNDGSLSNRKSINLPGIEIQMPYMTQRDKEDILFGIQQDVDFVAASFVRSAEDVLEVRRLLDENGGDKIKIIAKIENHEGVMHIDDIISVSNGVMVARGDMGVEIPLERLPEIQKKLIKKCYVAGKIAITATQMLESMIHHPRPTRAEVTDVANAIYDGTSAIMLSGETAVGEYAVETVETMAKIAETTESSINYIGRFERENVQKHTITDAISHAACTTAIDVGAKAIITVTQSGHTARMISKFRPFCPMIATTTSRKCYYQLSLTWGAIPIMNEMRQTADALFDSAIEKAEGTPFIEKGDLIVITGSSSVGVSGTTNVLRVHRI